MAFGLESEMILPLTESLPGLLVPPGPYAVACEVPDGARVVDIMYASLLHTPADIAEVESFAARLSRLSIAQTMVLALIWRERRITTPLLGSMTFMHPDRLETDYLLPFQKAELIEKDQRSWIVGAWGGVRPPQLVAVEAKLTDWRQALNQAEDNRIRADLSYIALPRIDVRHKGDNLIREARERGIGIIELDAGGKTDIVLRARRTPANACRDKWPLSVRLLADALRPNGRWSLVDAGHRTG